MLSSLLRANVRMSQMYERLRSGQRGPPNDLQEWFITALSKERCESEILERSKMARYRTGLLRPAESPIPTSSGRLIWDNRQLPECAWDDIHHRFKRNYNSWCYAELHGADGSSGEETGNKTITVTLMLAFSGEFLTKVNCGFNRPEGGYPLKIGNVAWEIEKWGKNRQKEQRRLYR